MVRYMIMKFPFNGAYWCCNGVFVAYSCIKRRGIDRQSVEIPGSIKDGLEKMSKTLGMTQNALINMAVATMVAKYQAKGMKIFFDLISPPGYKKNT